MDKLEAMKVFTCVVEKGSFVEASRTLNMSAPAVTRSVARLEEKLGTTLLNRTTRYVRLTDAGMHYYCDVKQILESVEDAEASLSGTYSEPSGKLTITAPVLFGERYITPIIAKYVDHYPQVSVCSIFQDNVSSLFEDNIDIAIRIGAITDLNLFAKRVGFVRKQCCASPDYLSKKSRLYRPNDLTEHQIIQSTAIESSNTWYFGDKKIELRPQQHYNQNSAAKQAALCGAGITRLMSYQIADELEQGRLNRVLKDFEPEPLPVNIVYLERRQANAKIRTFVDLATELLNSSMW